MIIVVTILTIFAAFHSVFRELARIATEPEAKFKTMEWRQSLIRYKARAFWEYAFYLFVINSFLFYYLEGTSSIKLHSLSVLYGYLILDIKRPFNGTRPK
jgi:hypothetical protein